MAKIVHFQTIDSNHIILLLEDGVLAIAEFERSGGKIELKETNEITTASKLTVIAKP